VSDKERIAMEKTPEKGFWLSIWLLTEQSSWNVYIKEAKTKKGNDQLIRSSRTESASMREGFVWLKLLKSGMNLTTLHWDFTIDPEWKEFSRWPCIAAIRIKETNPDLTVVMGGISPIDPRFVSLLKNYGLYDYFDAIAVHGFPLDWNHWQIDGVASENRGDSVGLRSSGLGNRGRGFIIWCR
jgi:hypothetical protein